MKLTFENTTLQLLIEDIRNFLYDATKHEAQVTAPKVEAPPPVVEAKPVEAKPAEKPKNKGGRPKGYKVAKKSNGTAAPKAKAPAKAPEPKPTIPPDEIEEPEQEVSFEDLELPAPEPEPEQLTPVQLAAIRVKTTQELQAAYASGKHTQVLELLKKHGNGAKSFRELQIEDFVPIRKAIDAGALA